MITLALLALLIVGVPVGVAFALLVMVRAEAWNIDLASLASIPYHTVSNFPLLAIPLFLLAGELMNRGGLIRQLTAICDILLGWLRAPLGHLMVLASALMGSFTGSSVATVAAIGSTVGPEMRRRGYPPGYTAALNAAAGLLGVLIPPSIPLILYGAVVGVSISELFLASVMPGIVMMLAFAFVHSRLSRRVLPGGQEVAVDGQAATHAAVGRFVERRSVAATLLYSVPVLLLPVLVLGGIYSGVFTPTEAAAVAAVYALLVTVLGRMTRFRELNGIFGRAAMSSAAILVVIGFTSIFNRAMVLEQVPQAIATYAIGFTESPLIFLLAVNLVLLLIGMFMETNAAVMLMGPLLAPAAAKFGIDPVHFGIILVINIEIGLLTPPMAANVYVAMRTNHIDLISLLRYLGWFIVVALAVLVAITYVPQFPLWYRYFF